MLEPVRFFWNVTRGHRLRPWRSPYLRWRLETYTGKRAETIGLSDALHVAWSERGQMIRFLRWLEAMRGFRRAGERGKRA